MKVKIRTLKAMIALPETEVVGRIVEVERSKSSSYPFKSVKHGIYIPAFSIERIIEDKK